LGGLLAFLWFNIPPARFYMSDTGTMALTLAIGTVAFMTDNLGGGYGIAVLPIIGGILVVTVASDIAQMLWKKMFGVKLLRIAPLHHHFEAIGWPGAKVTMRYWVLSIILAFLGVIIALSALPAMPQIPLN
jgi:phospho-N-acetylmuramoyl-pentapeptide-transferase